MNLADLSPADLNELACRAVGIEPIEFRYEIIGPWPVYRRVSEDPAECATLKAAASKVCGWPFVLQRPADSDYMFGAWIQVEPPSIDADGEFQHGVEKWITHSIYIDTQTTVQLADTEERAVALAVVAWALETGRLTKEDLA